MKKKVKISIFLVMILIVISIITFSCFYIFSKNYTPYVNFESRIEKIKNYKVGSSKIVGWIQVQGTDIDYPVILETDSAFQSGIDYLWQVNTFKDGENREVIYGHNILNVSSKPLIRHENHTRFEQLLGFSYYDYAKNNLYIQYTKDGKDEIYKIYAITFLDKTDDYGESSSDKEFVESYIKKAKELSLYDYQVDVNINDQIISLITCTRYFGLDGKTQFRVDARKLRENEKIKKYNVETNKNYDIIK